MPGRRINLGRITSEWLQLKEYLDEKSDFVTTITKITGQRSHPNPTEENQVGLFRTTSQRKAVTVDMERLQALDEKGLEIPCFLEAGPREKLRFNPHTVRVVIATTGGLAPGLHCVIHAIVSRHTNEKIYGPNPEIFGIYNGFEGLCSLADNRVKLTRTLTERWLNQGGSQLGSVRYYPPDLEPEESIEFLADKISENLESNKIDILYVIGGDGSLRVVNEIAKRCPTRSIIGIPKTMDNDILWVWKSFGFETAVEEATKFINTLRCEAEGTRRICIVELFGAESGFVAASASLASERVDAVLIPENFGPLDKDRAQEYLESITAHMQDVVQNHTGNPHGVVVVAEGVGAYLADMGACINGERVEEGSFIDQLMRKFKETIVDAKGNEVGVFTNRPKHNIRAVPGNSHDQIYCKRLGALAVDTALAGYTDCMVSHWLTEYVLVPTSLVIKGAKGIHVNGMLWKQVVSSTRQPLSPAECISPRKDKTKELA